MFYHVSIVVKQCRVMPVYSGDAGSVPVDASGASLCR